MSEKILYTFDLEYFDGSLVDIVSKFQEILEKHPNAVIGSNIDYGHCYYEGDTPTFIFTITEK